MRVQLETVSNREEGSFFAMFNPRLSDLFFWHYHPEYELVYIEGADGTRHVGDHMSQYKGSDLVLIGSNIPHLNFDYGVKTSYRKVVIHFRTDLIEKHLSIVPELKSIQTLFDHSRFGVTFSEGSKGIWGPHLLEMEELSPFEQYHRVLGVLHALSKDEGQTLLHAEPYVTRFNRRDHARLQAIYAFVDNNYHRKIQLQEVADISCMTKEAFCRYFKKATHYTFTEFLNRYRISHSKRDLMAGNSISFACYACGFDSLSYYNRIFKRVTGENPRDFRRRYVGS